MSAPGKESVAQGSLLHFSCADVNGSLEYGPAERLLQPTRTASVSTGGQHKRYQDETAMENVCGTGASEPYEEDEDHEDTPMGLISLDETSPADRDASSTAGERGLVRSMPGVLPPSFHVVIAQTIAGTVRSSLATNAESTTRGRDGPSTQHGGDEDDPEHAPLESLCRQKRHENGRETYCGAGPVRA